MSDMKPRIPGLLAVGLLAGVIAPVPSHAVLVSGSTAIYSPMRTCSANSIGPCSEFGPRTDFFAGEPGDAAASLSVSNAYGQVSSSAALTGAGAASIIRARTESYAGTRVNTLIGAIQSYTYTGSEASLRTPAGYAALAVSILLNPGDTVWVHASLQAPAGNGVIVDSSGTFVTAFDDITDLVPRLTVPEPGTLALLGLGLTGLGLSRRRNAA